MNKTLTKKFIYIVTVLALLAMMIPAMAVPVSAADPTLTMTIGGVADGTILNGKTVARNISGSLIKIVASEVPDNWSISRQPGAVDIDFVPASPSPTGDTVYVRGTYGEAAIIADFGDNVTRSVTKKWGYINKTVIDVSNVDYVTWNEAEKAFSASGTVTDIVYGTFADNPNGFNPMQGTILNWYLLSGALNLTLTPGEAQDLNAYYAGLARAKYVQFTNPADVNWDAWNHTTNYTNGWLGTGADPNGVNAAYMIQTVTDVNGESTVNIGAWFEENVQIVVVPQYPYNPNLLVTPELTSYNFQTREMEVVPQVRWAGEKIVLEANFGEGVTGDVNFYLQNQSIGTLEGIDSDQEQSTIWTEVDDNGTAYAILKSSVNGQADVSAALYPYGENGTMTNQYDFRVYFLNFESIQLSDADGKRDGHNAGLWTPENPYNDNFPDGYASNDLYDISETQTLNVSQDALERVQVRGYFVPPTGSQMSTRPAEGIDINGDGQIDLDDVMAPEGRWILPDDWARLAGYTNWQERRIHWDIMSAPTTESGVIADDPLGDYELDGVVVAAADVVGPFAPGLEQMTNTGWLVPNLRPAVDDPANLRDNIQTVVPDGRLDAWDAPMPPAKIIFEINSGVGFFKDAMKTDIYYMMDGTDKVYTNPFYQVLIPASPLIPPFNKYGGYDWDSYDGVHGAYEFWTVINQPEGVTDADAMHPTKVEVYSDNHGEAMVWLNGDWNLNLEKYIGKGGADVPILDEVGRTEVQASADYPYERVDQAIFSNTVEKVWLWGGQILGTDSHNFGTYDGEPIGQTEETYTKFVLSAGNYTLDNTTTGDGDPENDFGYSDDKVVWVWATDRDGLIDGVLGTQVHWRITGGAYITPVNADRISNFNNITRHIPLVDGFVSKDTTTVTGTILDGANRTLAISYLRAQTSYEAQLFNKKWPDLDADNYAVAAIDIYSASDTDATVEMILTGPDFGYAGQPNGNVYYTTNVDFAESYPLDDPIISGDANVDGVVDAADITKVERIIMGLDGPNINADTNMDGYIDMGDVVKISRIILKLD